MHSSFRHRSADLSRMSYDGPRGSFGGQAEAIELGGHGSLKSPDVRTIFRSGDVRPPWQPPLALYASSYRLTPEFNSGLFTEARLVTGTL